MMKRRDFLGGAAAGSILCNSTIWSSARADTLQAPIAVFAESPLQDALIHIGDAFSNTMGHWVRYSFGESVAVMRQLDRHAEVDLFITADGRWMTEVERRGFVQSGSQKKLVTNNLALIAPKDSSVNIAIRRDFPLLGALGDGKLAMADAAVPAGVFGQAALTSLDVWDQVAPRVVRGELLKGALALVANKQAPLGIAFNTDASDPRVRIVDIFPDDTHPPIVYRAALTKLAHDGSSEFLKYLQGPDARAIFYRYGFRDLAIR